MNKKEFIKSFAKEQNISQSEAAKQLDIFKEIVSNALLAGQKVNLGSDFGTFKPISRSGVIPGTTKTYNSKSIKFSVSAPFKRELN